MMDDLISRQAAIDCMVLLQREDEETYGVSIPEGFDGDRAAEALNRLPSAQQWIPVKKETPILPNIVLVCDSLGKILFDSYIDGSWTYCPYVVAWMPLPEPYKGETDELDTMQ